MFLKYPTQRADNLDRSLTTKAPNFLFSIQHNTDQKCRTHMYKLNPTIPSQILVMLMLWSIVATQNSAITQSRLKNKLTGF